MNNFYHPMQHDLFRPMQPGAPMPMQSGAPHKQLGLYPGAGVAPGGQQGRIGAVHGGIGGARQGGYTPGASGKAPGQAAGYDELMKALSAAINPTRHGV